MAANGNISIGWWPCGAGIGGARFVCCDRHGRQKWRSAAGGGVMLRSSRFLFISRQHHHQLVMARISHRGGMLARR